ncbi:MAG: YicC family protein [Bacillati bacterium ANGP1]|uniref:YicC family protein n=1 Tax=Candidatus Segetimicrobium genomatis TaxID=2569760 RepID=A0A537JAM3_9BACT|nr:MAG: YicC family protein [Terrabacteria group bacterium ANGP1]
MTGFGAGDLTTVAGRYVVEARSLNHRFLEVAVRLPRDLAPLEERIRALVQGRILRGRVEIAIIRKAFTNALNDLKQALDLSGTPDLSMLVGLPDLIKIEEPKEDLEEVWPSIAGGLGQALTRLVAMREDEGGRLARDLGERMRRVGQRVDDVEQRAPRVVKDYAARLSRRIAELMGAVPVDEGRVAAEVAIFADRCDISEELTRFRSHLTQMRQTLEADGAVGRTLEFIVQELGREANTMGSKANDVEVARDVIAIKGELESLREQIQNVE